MKLYDIEMKPIEFLWKIVVVLLFIVPICVGGTSLAFFVTAPADNFIARVCFTAFGAIVGTITAIVLTSVIIKIGHKEV